MAVVACSQWMCMAVKSETIEREPVRTLTTQAEEVVLKEEDQCEVDVADQAKPVHPTDPTDMGPEMELETTTMMKISPRSTTGEEIEI